jgi:hypothetical protein
LPTSQSSVWMATRASTSRSSSSLCSASTKPSATSLDIPADLSRVAEKLRDALHLETI